MSLGLSQKEISIRLEYQDTRIRITRNSISNYELGKRVPPLIILYAYAKLANVSVNALAAKRALSPASLASGTGLTARCFDFGSRFKGRNANGSERVLLNEINELYELS